MPLIIKDIDDDLKYVFWNKQCELQGGYSREEIIGKTDIDVYGKDEASITGRLILKLLKNEILTSQ